MRDAEVEEPTRSIRPRLWPVVATVLVAIGGLAVLPTEDPRVVEAASPESMDESLMEVPLPVEPVESPPETNRGSGDYVIG